MFLSEVDREKYAPQIDTLIDKLYEYETPDGGWPYPLRQDGQDRRTSSPTTRSCALAEAGRRPETDEHLARAVKAMLAAQRPEGSWEGDPVYQGFNTPFPRHAVCRDGPVNALPGNNQGEELGRGVSARPPQLSPRTTCRCFCSNSISTGTWLRSRCCARFVRCWPTATSRSRAKPRHARLGTWPTRELFRF